MIFGLRILSAICVAVFFTGATLFRAFSNEHQKSISPLRNGSARRQGIENECMKFELNVGMSGVHSKLGSTNLS